MDNLIVFVPFLLGLTLFSVLWMAERLSAHRYRKRIERRLEVVLTAQDDRLTMPPQTGMLVQDNKYSLTYPNIPKPRR